MLVKILIFKFIENLFSSFFSVVA